MRTNRDTYIVKFTNKDSECSFTGECEILSDNRMRIGIIEHNKVINLDLFMEWCRSYSEGIVNRIPYMEKKHVTLINKNSEKTTLYNCSFTLVDIGEFTINDIEKISFEVVYQWMSGKIIHYIPPIKLNIQLNNLTEEQAENIKEYFGKWGEIIKNDDSRWASFFIEKDFKPNIKILSE